MPYQATWLSDAETPVSLFYKVSHHQPMAFLLESNEDDTRLARYSFIGFSPIKTLRFVAGQAFLWEAETDRISELAYTNPLILLKNILQHSAESLFTRDTPMRDDIPFMGGWVGYMGYGATRYFENIPQQTEDPLGVPDGYYGLYDTFILFDHLCRRIDFISHRPEQEAKALCEEIQASLLATPPLPPLTLTGDDMPDEAIFNGISGPFTRDSFCERVREAKAYIQEGQVFQIVLSQRFSQPISVPPIQVYRMIRAINPSPYTYYLKFPEFVYLGSSPETFVHCHNGEVDLRVLAGTRPRGLTAEIDKQLEADLLQDQKELAEHYMLVDLGRNDLGRVCRPDSIVVGNIATLTRYTHVMHLATRLSGTLREDKTCFDAFQSFFPRGTVSGAPKIRAMQLLSQLEPERRGIYSGAVGYFDYAGNMDSAIAIRSVLIKDGMAHVNAGAGIVYDSDPLMEYHETRNKAKSILKAIQLAERNHGDALAVD